MIRKLLALGAVLGLGTLAAPPSSAAVRVVATTSSMGMLARTVGGDG